MKFFKKKARVEEKPEPTCIEFEGEIYDTQKVYRKALRDTRRMNSEFDELDTKIIRNTDIGPHTAAAATPAN